MQKHLIFIVIFFIKVACFAQNEKNVTSQIKNVTVFLNRAEVTNIASVGLGIGTTTLVFNELSTKLVQQSIQVQAQSVTILAVKYRINYLRSQAKAEKIKQLEAQIEETQDNLNQLNGQKKIYQEEESMILSNKAIGGDNQGVSAQKLKEIADFYRTRLLEISQKTIELNKSIRTSQEKLQKLQRQVQEENANANKPSSEILVTVKAETPVNANFELTYIVIDAGWVPVYDIRAKDAKSPVQLSYKANVSQNTGVDWNNVKITLSTGNPTQGGNKPELSPWYVDFYTYQNLKGRAAGIQVTSNSRSMEDKKVENVETDEVSAGITTTTADFTDVVENTLATEFEINIPYSIPSDGKFQLVDIQRYDVSTQYSHSCSPKLDKDVFLIARLTDWEKLNLLSGNANVYFEGTFIGETYLNAKNTKDTLTVSLGRDKKIVVERTQIKDFTSKKTFGSHIKEERGYEITVRNSKKERIDLTIEEQIPISQNNKIDVELLEATGAKFNPVTGKIVWRFNMEPQETRKLTSKFSVKHPKGTSIVL
jgi:uncharacterized protein (TIGR02231 family)